MFRRAALCLLAASLWLPAALALDTGDATPALTGTTLDGKAFDLAALKGKVVVVNLWATWCEPCRAEMPLLDAFYRKHRDQGLVLLGLDENDPEDEADVRKVMAAFGFPALMAEKASDNGFRARVVPVTYVIDAAGKVHAKFWAGGTPVTEENLEKAVAPLLAVMPPG
ncbi:MAG: TlpA family protein disulfide reductase [Bacillota bacterium]